MPENKNERKAEAEHKPADDKGHEVLKESQDAAAKAKAEAEAKEAAATLAGEHSTAGGNQPLP